MFKSHNDRKYFALFVREFPEYQKLFESWKLANESGDAKNEVRLSETLHHIMRVNGWA